MSDDRELVELLAAIDATPRASWVAGLRADLDAAWEIEDAGYLDSLRTTTVTLIDHEPIQPTSGRRWPIVIAAAAAVVLVGVLVVYDGDVLTPSDEPSPTVTVPPTTPPRPLPLTGPNTGELEPGTYYDDQVNGTPTPRIFATVGPGWREMATDELWVMVKRSTSAGPSGDIGWMMFSRAVAVFSDACHPSNGYHPGPVPVTLDDLVAALTEQQGWAEVTTPTDISIDGYAGKAFQRTAPTDMTDCDRVENDRPRIPIDDGAPGYPHFQSWESPDGIGGGGAEPGEIETLWVVDIDGTVVIISADLWPGPTAAAYPDFAADVLDSIRIERT